MECPLNERIVLELQQSRCFGAETKGRSPKSFTQGNGREKCTICSYM